MPETGESGTANLSALYDEHYFRTYRDAPYERSALWLSLFRAISDNIVRVLNPGSVLDAGCAMGLLVEALRDRGVEAYGIDVSAYAVEHARPDIKPYCTVGSLVTPQSRRFDLIVCQEVLEHLPPADAAKAVENLCAASDDILFSSTPDHFDEDTHINVQPPEYWAALFARYGFVRDVEFDTPVLPAPWACRFRRTQETWPTLVVRYERRLTRLLAETTVLRARALETKAALAAKDRELSERPGASALERTIADQQAHLDALSRRLEYMSDRESELRTLLHDAHEQLLERDEASQSGPGSVADLHRIISERTEWAERMVVEAEKRLAIVHEQQTAIEQLQRAVSAYQQRLQHIEGSRLYRAAARLRGWTRGDRR